MSIKLLDTIYKLTDNADKVDGKHASDFATSGHTHSSLSTVGDKRTEATTPNSYSNKFIFQGLKTNSSFGSPSTDTYSYVLGLRGWSDSSGGNSWELAFNNSGIYSRNGASTSWGSWYRLLDSNNSSVSKSGETLTVKINGTSQSLTNTNTTYSAGTGLSLSGTTFNHASSVTAGTAGTSSATSGSTLAVPYVTVNATGHVTGYGTHTHTITGFASSSHNHDSVYLKLSGGTLTGNFAANNNTKTPFNLTTNLYYVNKALNWSGSSYLRNVILLIPVQTSTNWSGYNYIDGKFLLWKNGGNVYDIVEVNLNNVYNSLEYRLLASGQNSSSYKLCICKYNGVSYYAIDCPYHANPYNNAEFYGHIRSSLTGGTGTVNLPLTVDYYNENTQTVLNSEVKDSITSTLTTSVVTSVSSRNLFSIAGFSGSLSGNASSASKLGTNAGSATNPVYFSGGIPVACTYSLNKTVPSDAKFTDTTYSAGTGISLSGTTFSNSGVRSVATGDNNGTIKVNTNGTSTNVAVKGLGSAAYLDTTGTFSAVTHSDYNNNQTQLVSRSFMSYWTGAYNSSGTSNLTYCKHGAFGTAATKAYTTSITSGSGSLITSGAVYTALSGKSDTGHTHSNYAASDHTHSSYAGKKSVAFTPAESELTTANVLTHTGGFSIAKGTWSYAGNGYVVAGDFGNIDLAGCSILTFGSSSAYTQLYITAPAQSGHSGKTNEIFFYNNHGSDYSPGWTRVITNRNYTSYCAKASHTHSYAGSSSAGGAATSANKLNTDAGGATTPVYFTGGVPVACSVDSGAPTASTIAVRNSSGDIFARLIRQTYADQSTISGGLVFRVNNSSDNYLRVCNSASAIRTFLGVSASGHTHNYAGSDSAGGKAYDLYAHSGNPGSSNGVGVRWYTMSSTASGAAGYAGTNAGFPVSNNANGMLWLGNHSGPYGGQLGISSNGRLYYRFISNGSFSTTANGGSWNRIAWTGDIPSSLKCPNSLTIQANGTSLGSYDGSAAKTFNITYSNVGAAAASHTHSYIPLSGGTLSSGTSRISRAGSSVSWYQGRANAMMYISSYSGYNAIASMKTTNGDWSMGVYSDNKMYFTYVTDTNYNSSTNTTTAQIVFQPNGYIVGNLSGYATSAGNADTLDGYHASSFSLTSHTHSYAASSHTHNYAGSSSAGGAATSANKLNTNAGSATKPVYFSGGVPVQVTGCMVQYWAIYEIFWGSGGTTSSRVKQAGNFDFLGSVITHERVGQIYIYVNYPEGFSEKTTMIFGNGDHVGSTHTDVGYLTIGKQVYGLETGSGSNAGRLRLSFSDDASTNWGYAYLYFLCIS